MWIRLLCVRQLQGSYPQKYNTFMIFQYSILQREKNIQNGKISIIGLWVERLPNEFILYGSTLFTVDWKAFILHTGSTVLSTLYVHYSEYPVGWTGNYRLN